MSDRIKINTPRTTTHKVGDGEMSLKWNKNFGRKWTSQFNQSQVFVDSEVLRLSEPFTPFLTGILIKSGTLGTDIGSGLVRWIAPYARAQYYLKRVTKSITGKLRGSFWFERMKAIYGKGIILGARKIAGGSKRK